MDQENHQQQADDAKYEALADQVEGTKEPVEQPEAEKPAEQAKPEHKVPLATFLEQKNEAKRLRDALAAKEAEHARLDERLNILSQRMAEPVPDEEKDPLGWQKHQIQTVQKTQGEIKAELEAANEREARRQHSQRLAMQAAADEREYAAKTADYWDAARHFFTVNREHAQAMGLDPQQTLALVSENITKKALAEGKSPAAEIYRLAQLTGYRPQAANGEGNDMQGQSADEKKLETIERGLQQRGSASSGGNARPKINRASLLEMSNEEFDKATKGKNWERFFQ